MRSIGRNVDGVTGPNDGLLTAKGDLKLAVKQDEGLFKVMTMRSRTPAGRHMHVDHAEAVVGVFGGDGDRVRVSNHTDMLGCWTIRLSDPKARLRSSAGSVVSGI